MILHIPLNRKANLQQWRFAFLVSECATAIKLGLLESAATGALAGQRLGSVGYQDLLHLTAVVALEPSIICHFICLLSVFALIYFIFIDYIVICGRSKLFYVRVSKMYSRNHPMYLYPPNKVFLYLARSFCSTFRRSASFTWSSIVVSTLYAASRLL